MLSEFFGVHERLPGQFGSVMEVLVPVRRRLPAVSRDGKWVNGTRVKAFGPSDV